MKHTRVVSTKCTPGFACRAFSDTILVCFIVNEHTTKCSRYRNIQGDVHLHNQNNLGKESVVKKVINGHKNPNDGRDENHVEIEFY